VVAGVFTILVGYKNPPRQLAHFYAMSLVGSSYYSRLRNDCKYIM